MARASTLRACRYGRNSAPRTRVRAAASYTTHRLSREGWAGDHAAEDTISTQRGSGPLLNSGKSQARKIK